MADYQPGPWKQLAETWSRVHCRAAHTKKHGGQKGNFAYSHSIVAGGLLLMSYTTRFTPGTSFTMRLEILASTS
jgi:hypothetical protein